MKWREIKSLYSRKKHKEGDVSLKEHACLLGKIIWLSN